MNPGVEGIQCLNDRKDCIHILFHYLVCGVSIPFYIQELAKVMVGQYGTFLGSAQRNFELFIYLVKVKSNSF